MTTVNIVFNKKYNKFDGMVDGKVVSRCSTKEAVERALAKQGIEMGVKALATEASVFAKTEVTFSVDERFQFIEQFVKLISKKTMNSLIITGDGGLGKSYTVVETLKKLGMTEMGYGDLDGDFVVIKGFSTAKALYRTLWENNGKVIVFDDADSVHKDAIGANILKGALDSNDKRVISWGAETSERDDLPNRFEFYGRVIFISNLPLRKFPQALLSRSMKVDLTLSTDEKLERIAHVFGEVDCRDDEKEEVLQFIKKNAEQITDLNIRSALNVLKLRQEIGVGFERIALYTCLS